jgi:hypothetical protein
LADYLARFSRSQTSENLVPSVEFELDSADPTRDSPIIGYYAPGDFAKFAIPFHPSGGDVATTSGGVLA